MRQTDTSFRIMYTPSSQWRGRKRAGYGRRRPYVTAEQFRDARIFSGLTRLDAAEMLGVSLRTIGSWELGRARPSWAAFKLLRFLKHGAFIDPAWAGYTVVSGRLITPENHAIEPHDMAWLSLLVRRSRAFSDLLKQRQGQAADAGARAGAAADLGQFSSARGASDGAPSSGREAAAALGLSLYRTSDKYFPAQVARALLLTGDASLVGVIDSGAKVGPKWPHEKAQARSTEVQPENACGSDGTCPGAGLGDGGLTQRVYPDGPVGFRAPDRPAGTSVDGWRSGIDHRGADQASSQAEGQPCQHCEGDSVEAGGAANATRWPQRTVPVRLGPQGQALPSGVLLSSGGAA